jgi:hypothetical protein
MVVAQEAEVLDTASMRALREVSGDMGTLEFATETAQVGALEPGDVLLAAPSPTFPGGICRKVASVGEVSGRVVVTTEQATLTDVIDQGEVAFREHITAADVSQAGVAQPGVRLVTGPSAAGPLSGTGVPVLRGDATDGFGFELTTTIAEKVEVEGSVWLDPDVYVDWEVGWGGVESAALTQTLSTSTDLTVSLKASLDQEVKQTIYKQTLAVITIMVGPVPVVVTPEFEVYVGASGEVTAGVTAGVSLTTETTAGISYDGDDWTPTSTFTYQLTPQAPQLFGSLELKGFAGAGLAFKIYAVAGPEAKIEPFVKLEAATNETPWWTLKAGVDTELGFKVEALDITMLEFAYTFHLFEYIIDQAGSGSGAAGGSASFQIPSIRGQILDAATSRGLGGAAVEARLGAPPGGAVAATATAAADGTYILWGLAPGTYTVAASKGGYADNTRASTVTAGATTTGQNLQLTAVENQGVSGLVVQKPGGAGIDGAYVGLHEGASTEWSWPYDSRHTWGGGTYEFIGLEPGQYWIYADSPSYFPDRVSFSVVAGQKTTAPLLELVPYAAQGLSGTVTSSLSGAGVAGATVELHEGWDSPASELVRTATTAADGTYAIDALETGRYTIVVTKAGYVDRDKDTTVYEAQIRAGQNLILTPADTGGVARTTGNSSFLRYPTYDGMLWGADGLLSDYGTCELWYRPSVYAPGTVLMASFEYGNFTSGSTTGTYPVLCLITGLDDAFHFGLNENLGEGGGPGQGTWHWIGGTTFLELNQWYHLAVQWGAGGMKLFVNGHLEGSDPWEGFPEADDGAGTRGGGWYSLGENDCHESWILHGTAQGSYKQLRISSYERHLADFTPPDIALSDDDTVLLDHLVGGSYGDPNGFVWVP